MFNTQDPLFFDYDKLYINGGIKPYIDKIRKQNNFDLPINKRVYILYHMGKQDVYDPEFFYQMETGLNLKDSVNEEMGIKGERLMNARYSMAAVVAYWRSNCGSAWALKYYE